MCWEEQRVKVAYTGEIYEEKYDGNYQHFCESYLCQFPHDSQAIRSRGWSQSQPLADTPFV